MKPAVAGLIGPSMEMARMISAANEEAEEVKRKKMKIKKIFFMIDPDVDLKTVYQASGPVQKPPCDFYSSVILLPSFIKELRCLNALKYYSSKTRNSAGSR